MIKKFVILIIIFSLISCRFDLPEDPSYDSFISDKISLLSKDSLNINVDRLGYNKGFLVVNDLYLFGLSGLYGQENFIRNDDAKAMDEILKVGDRMYKRSNSDTILIYTLDADTLGFVYPFDCIIDPKCSRGHFWE